MKKRFIMSGALILTALGLTVSLLSSSNAGNQVVLASDWSEFDSGDAKHGTSYTVPTMTYTYNGTVYTATCIVTYPDQSQTAANEIELNQAGIYIFEYSVDVSGEVHNITKQVYVEFPQLYVGDNQRSSIEYYDIDKAQDIGARREGLYAKIAFGDSLNFTKPIYLDELTSSNALVKGYLAPTSKGSADFNQLFIKLTDADDPEKFVIMQYYSHIYANSNGTSVHMSSAMARSDAQPYFAAVHQTQGLHTNDTWGVWSGVSFDGIMTDKGGYADYLDEAQFCFGLDYQSKIVYGTGYGKGSTLDLILDLDDSNNVSSPWLGFTSNRVFMSIYGESYSGLTANMVITEVAGVSAEDLQDNYFTDLDEPEITVHSDYETLPNAVLGYDYPVPEATAYDQVSLECPVKTEVFYNYYSPDRVNIKIENNKFHMDKAGTYTIAYTSYDKAGNKAESLNTISVFEYLSKPEFDLPNLPVSAYVGEYYQVNRDIEISGGVGKKDIFIYYEINEQRHLVDGIGFRITELKEYKVIYQVKDMIGQVSEKSLVISVSDGGEPILENEIVFPKYFISKGYYDFPEERVFIYENNQLVEKPLSLEIIDDNGSHIYENEQYNPVVNTNGTEVTVKAVYDDKVFQTEHIYTVQNIGTETSARSINLLNYFIEDGFDKELTADDGVTLAANISGNASMDFATPFLSNSFNLNIAKLLNFSNNSGIQITLLDAKNPSKTAICKIYLADEVTYFEVDGVKKALLNNDINVGNNDYHISFSDGMFYCGDISLSVNDSSFGNMQSDTAYMNLSLYNSQANSKFNLITFCQCSFSSRTSKDRVSPVILMDKNYGGTEQINSIYHIDPSYAFDVLSPSITFKLDVMSPSGEYLSSLDGTKLEGANPNNGYDIELKDFGQYYFTLTAIEDERFLSGGSALTISYYLRVYDDIAPQISFVTGMVSEARVGDVIKLPEFTVSDNVTSSERLIVQRIMLSPSGKYNYLSETDTFYKLNYAGKYEYIIHVIDESGNITTRAFTIMVSE